MRNRFGTALNCIDGRTQIPVTEWLKVQYGLVDLITEPGMDRVLSHGPACEVARLRENTIVSLTAYASQVIAVVGHFDCAANPVSKCQHFKDIATSTQVVRSWGFAHVIGLWVDEYGRIEVVCT
ncbi:carbonic anhydrase [Guptibacillus hwajinpoensis]|uniref:carbonic anhydrase n=1 Tax=Guptibacillus hwajinpoensis TaxID=208199 RepID=UPI0034E3874E